MSIDRGPMKLALTGTALVLLILGLAAWFGGGYGQVSDQCYALATSLVSACNLQSLERVEQVATHLQGAIVQNALPGDEARWLSDIIELARVGEWEQAQSASRRLMQAQLVIANELPDLD